MAASDPKSTKPSGASSGPTQKPPSAPVLFLDEGLGRIVVATALRGAGASVEVFLDHFAPGTPDDLWLGDVARRGWIVLTKDYRIGYSPLARAAITSACAQVYVLKRSASLRGDEMAERFVKALPAIRRIHLRALPLAYFIARVGKDGRVKVWWP